jgi:hypothetical protein
MLREEREKEIRLLNNTEILLIVSVLNTLCQLDVSEIIHSFFF